MTICNHCGNQVAASKGNVVKDPQGKDSRVNPDQQVFFHKRCRQEGRRMGKAPAYTGKAVRWFPKTNKYGKVTYQKMIVSV